MSSKSKKISPQQKEQRDKLKIKKRRIKTIVVTSIAAITLACVIAAIVLAAQYNARAKQLCDATWTPVSAKDASGDEARLGDIYDVMYTNYQGSLNFNKDGTFDFWMAPGLPDDGTHTGTYELDGDTINVTFDEGTQTKFYIQRDKGFIKTIELGYNDYTVYFGEKVQ